MCSKSAFFRLRKSHHCKRKNYEISLTFVSNKSKVGWFPGSLEALSLDNGKPVVKVLETGIVGDVIHKHHHLQE